MHSSILVTQRMIQCGNASRQSLRHVREWSLSVGVRLSVGMFCVIRWLMCSVLSGGCDVFCVIRWLMCSLLSGGCDVFFVIRWLWCVLCYQVFLCSVLSGGCDVLWCCDGGRLLYCQAWAWPGLGRAQPSPSGETADKSSLAAAHNNNILSVLLVLRCPGQAGQQEKTKWGQAGTTDKLCNDRVLSVLSVLSVARWFMPSLDKTVNTMLPGPS